MSYLEIEDKCIENIVVFTIQQIEENPILKCQNAKVKNDDPDEVIQYFQYKPFHIKTSIIDGEVYYTMVIKYHLFARYCKEPPFNLYFHKGEICVGFDFEHFNITTTTDVKERLLAILDIYGTLSFDQRMELDLTPIFS